MPAQSRSLPSWSAESKRFGLEIQNQRLHQSLVEKQSNKLNSYKHLCAGLAGGLHTPGRGGNHLLDRESSRGPVPAADCLRDFGASLGAEDG